MDAKDKVFIVSFVLTLSLLSYYLGDSITGYVTQSMYCEEGICKEFCKFDSDCKQNEICCKKINFGVCESSLICQESYIYQPAEVENIAPISEAPSPTQGKIAVYSILIILSVIIGIIYFSKRKKLLTKTKKPKRKKR